MLDPTFIPIRNQSYLKMLAFEEMDLPWWRSWFGHNWILSVYIVVSYIGVIFALQAWMVNRQAYDLRRALVVWNFSIATFSLFAFLRCIPELYYLLSGPGGLYHTACDMTDHGMSMAFWAKTYTLSKIGLLMDTIFIVLRKRKLILLHWYHHGSVLILSWYTYMTYIPLLRFVGTMNYFVHTFMYSYYGLKAANIKVPSAAGKFITVLELAQMVIGLYVTGFAISKYYIQSQPCTIATSAIFACCIIYSTLLVLIIQFYGPSIRQRRKLKSA